MGDPRGTDIAVVSGRNAEARYGLMIKSLPAHAPSGGRCATSPRRWSRHAVPSTTSRTPTPSSQPRHPAGYTYLGQFIDHNMTLDHTPLSQQRVDPSAPGKLLLEECDGVLDLPRKCDGTAIIGDARNDENLIICQMHVAFLRLHNRLVAEGRTFEDARRQVRWHFQWVLVNDFLRRIVGQDVLNRLLVQGSDGKIRQRSSFYKPSNPLRPMMPVECSVAAYRFGHSMIRAEYQLQDTPDSSLTVPILSPTGGTCGDPDRCRPGTSSTGTTSSRSPMRRNQTTGTRRG